MTSQEPETLFPVEQVPRLTRGERVLLTTMAGEEKCLVVDVHREGGFPMVTLTTGWGDTVVVNVASVRRAGS